MDIEGLTSGGNWECLKSDGSALTDVFLQYGEKRGLFSGETKKHQFADAIVFELLKREATAEMPVFIYSRDKDFEGVAIETENFQYANSLGDLFSLCGFLMDRNVPEVERLIVSYRDTIVKSVSKWFDQSMKRSIEMFGERFRARTLEYITQVNEKLNGSVRFGNHILVFWKVIIRAQLPP